LLCIRLQRSLDFDSTELEFRWRLNDRVVCGSGCGTGANSPTANGVRLVRTDPPRAETELVNVTELSGAIALIYRGACAFTEKAQRAQSAGAVAVVFVNSDDEETHPAPVSFHRQTKQRIESNSDLRNAYVEIGSGSRK
jgi:hypothetical protein